MKLIIIKSFGPSAVRQLSQYFFFTLLDDFQTVFRSVNFDYRNSQRSKYIFLVVLSYGI